MMINKIIPSEDKELIAENLDTTIGTDQTKYQNIQSFGVNECANEVKYQYN